MKTNKLIIAIFLVFMGIQARAQSSPSKAKADPGSWTVHNRKATFDNGVIHLNAQSEDGIAWLKGSDFKNGTIELEIKGKNTPGQSFVGVAFHGKDNETFDAIYFRPFNFLNPERSGNSVQYISMPDNDWSTLRNAFPGKYEHKIDPVPQPVDGWFHVKIMVDFPEVKVYVNGSDKPTLQIQQISDRKHGKVGLWVGNGSEGWFKNLVVTPN